MQGIPKGSSIGSVKSLRRSARLAAKYTKKGKEKVQAEVDITPKHKKEIKSSNSNSSSRDKEEGPLRKQPRKLMDARDYRALFMRPIKNMRDILEEEPSVNGPRMSARLASEDSEEPSVNSHPRSANLASEDDSMP